jgi:signal transduction histidine kinase
LELSLKLLDTIKARSQPLIMHPAIFVGGFVFLGLLFALQEWISYHVSGYKISLDLLLKAWGVQYLIWGVLCWLLWFYLGRSIQNARMRWILMRLIPLSILVAVGEEMIWVLCFPDLPLGHARMAFWHRVIFHLDAELVDNILIFWGAIILFRGIGYYERYREKEQAATQLAMQLAHAQLRALRMQLNPHFLFNTMNSISSLMQSDVASADTMLEQLGCLLRISLERGEAQLIPLSDEMEFCEVYLALQDQRFAGRVRREVHVEPSLHDALVPAMLLQPIIENAYAHGLSRLDCDGLLTIDVRRGGGRMKLSVSNNGAGLNPDFQRHPAGRGVGLTNVKDRLRLHYGKAQYFSIRETSPGRVEVSIALPLQFSTSPTQNLTGYGA